MEMEQRLRNAQRIDDISTLLIHAVGVKAVRQYPVPSALYVMGILFCLLFNGSSVSEQQYRQYDATISTFDYSKLDDLTAQLHIAENDYYRSKGWFTCDAFCLQRREVFDKLSLKHKELKNELDSVVRDAKGALGLFSSFGVDETRDLFWTRFSQGKAFATRQSKWDALFIGLSAMRRDESFLSYLLRAGIQILMNFTIGMIGSVVAFVWSLYGLIQTYKASLISGLIFFLFASIAAIAFGLTWIIGMYICAAGTVYVGAKLIAHNMRIEGGGATGGIPPARMEYRAR